MSSVLVTGQVAANHAAGAVQADGTRIRVVVVDDAVVVRSLLARWIDAEPDMHVVASLPSGRETIAWFDKNDADIVLLDIEMPDLDGITALPLLLQKKRDLTVIMVSTFTRRSAEISLRALSLGAADYIPKPESTREVTTSISFRRELLEKVRALGHRRRPPVRITGAAAGAALGDCGCPRPCAAHGAARPQGRGASSMLMNGIPRTIMRKTVGKLRPPPQPRS